MGIFGLPDSFVVAQDGTPIRDKCEYIRIAKPLGPIGTSVGVLGYPLTVVTFDAQDIMKPKLGDVILRADVGVVNAQYTMAPDHVMYDYTMAFNPGNSGGPVFDTRTGRAIALVRGFKTIDINAREVQLPPGLQITNYTEPSFIALASATYSVGTALGSLEQLLASRGISFG